MAVYKTRIIIDLVTAIKEMSKRILGECRITLSSEDFISAFIKPEHVTPLKEVQQLVGIVGELSFATKLHTSEGIEVYSSVSFGYGRPPIIIPEYAKFGLSPAIPEALKARITSYIDERYRIGRMFGDAIDALYYLNENSGNAAAMAVLFPALSTLLAASDPEPDSPNAKRAAKLANMKSFGTVATLPKEVRLRILECSALIMSTSMLPTRTGDVNYKSGEAVINGARPIRDVPDFIGAATGRQQGDASFV